MEHYTVVLQVGDDPRPISAVIQADAFKDANEKAIQLFAAAGGGSGSVSIGRGRDDNVEWLGAWDFVPGAEPRWEADS